MKQRVVSRFFFVNSSNPYGLRSADPGDPDSRNAECEALRQRLEQVYQISLTGDRLFKGSLSLDDDATHDVHHRRAGRGRARAGGWD